jgi:hypothetical protein
MNDHEVSSPRFNIARGPGFSTSNNPIRTDSILSTLSKSSNASSINVHLSEHVDLVNVYARENSTMQKRVKKRKRIWQTCIFLMTVMVNMVVSFQRVFANSTNNSLSNSSFSYSVSLMRGIGFILLGNLYDNVLQPKKITTVCFLITGALLGLVILNLS